MRHLYTIMSACAFAVLLTACSGANNSFSPTAQALPASQHAPSSKYAILHSFGNGNDGEGPSAPLLDVSGTLYGTTVNGGPGNQGTVFDLSASGANYNSLYSFPGNYSAGAQPNGGLVNVNGTLYGMTLYGGAGSCYAAGPNYGCGTVFSITTGGTENVVHSFVEGSYGSTIDGIYPYGALTYVNGTLYGQTTKGGPNSCQSDGTPYSCGTIFGISAGASGYYAQLLAFDGSNGANPFAALTYESGSFYGTTLCGGAYGSTYCGGGGQPGGTIFRIGFAGKEKVLHSFGNGSDGSHPLASVIDVNGTLFGTTYDGGAYGQGTVFSVSPGGANYSTLYSFGSTSSDGAHPAASLLDVSGTLYGTTQFGGAYNKGTIFSIGTNGGEKLLYSFGTISNDGNTPVAALIEVGKTLYSTTNGGGAYGGGTVFSFKP